MTNAFINKLSDQLSNIPISFLKDMRKIIHDINSKDTNENIKNLLAYLENLNSEGAVPQKNIFFQKAFFQKFRSNSNLHNHKDNYIHLQQNTKCNHISNFQHKKDRIDILLLKANYKRYLYTFLFDSLKNTLPKKNIPRKDHNL